MNIQEPDFSEMIRKSDSTRRAAKKETTIDLTKKKTKIVPKEVINKTPIIAIVKPSKTKTVVDQIKKNTKEVPKEVLKKAPIVSIKKPSKKEKTVQLTKNKTKVVLKKDLNKTSIVAAKKLSKPVKKKTYIDTSEIIYTVQIAALDAEDRKYSTINNVLTYNENSLVKYSLGSFKTFNEAQKYRSQIINKYKGAFVKALKNNIPVYIK